MKTHRYLKNANTLKILCNYPILHIRTNELYTNLLEITQNPHTHKKNCSTSDRLTARLQNRSVLNADQWRLIFNDMKIKQAIYWLFAMST